MLTDQATRDPLAGVMPPSVVAELVLGRVAMQMLGRDMVMCITRHMQ